MFVVTFLRSIEHSFLVNKNCQTLTLYTISFTNAKNRIDTH